MYSAGVIFWEIASRKRFFSEIAFLSQVEDMVIAGQRPDIPQDCEDTVPEFAGIIRDCWQNDPSARPPFKQVVERISQILEKYFPEAANYDAPAMRAYQEAQNSRNLIDRQRMEEREAREKQRKENLEQARKLEESLQNVSAKKNDKKKKQKAINISTDGTNSDHSTEETSSFWGEEDEETGTDRTVYEDEEEEEEEEDNRKGSAIITPRNKKNQHENLSKLMEVFLSRRSGVAEQESNQKRRPPSRLTASQSYTLLPGRTSKSESPASGSPKAALLRSVQLSPRGDTTLNADPDVLKKRKDVITPEVKEPDHPEKET